MRLSLFTVAVIACATVTLPSIAADMPVPSKAEYEVDANWPKIPLPNNWAIGAIGGLSVDALDNVWIVNRRRTLAGYEKAAAANPPGSVCCVPAPPVIAFDPAGNVIQAWGGPGQGYDWPTSEHGIYVDHKGNVWVGGNATRPASDGAPVDGMVLKFTREGKFLMQIGGTGPAPKKSLDTGHLWGAADIAVDPETNEAYVADGYGNHRLIVFDADTGEFKRMWGAYGKPPTDEDIGRYQPGKPPATQFRNVHCVELGNDGFVYVCDRDNNRMQVFKKDGTFVREHVYAPETQRGAGSVGNISMSPDADQSVIAIADIGNYRVTLVHRETGEVIQRFGTYGNYAGQMNRMHQAAFDSKGNIFISEAAGKRVQKFSRLPQ